MKSSDIAGDHLSVQKSLAMVLTIGAVLIVGAAIWINFSRPPAPIKTESLRSELPGSEAPDAKKESPDAGEPTLVSREDLPLRLRKMASYRPMPVASATRTNMQVGTRRFIAP